MDGRAGTNGIPAAHIPSPAGRMKAGFEENGLPTEIGGLPLMPDEQSAEKIAELFKLISDGTRLRVLVLLCISEKCVSEIADAFGMSLPKRKTLAIEIGMQNSGLGVALAMKFFDPASAVPSAIFSVWHNISGSILATFFSNMGAKSKAKGGADAAPAGDGAAKAGAGQVKG